MKPGFRPFCQMSYPLVLGPEKSYSNLGQCQIGGNLVNWNNWPETTNITMIKHWVINEASELPAARMEASLWVSNFKSSTAAPHIYLSWAWVFFLYCLPSGLFERWLVSHFLVGSTLNLASSWRSWAFWPSRFSRIEPRSPVHPMTQKYRRTMVDFHATKHISSHQSGKMKRNNVNNLNIQRIANAATMVIV